ncbi:MAG: GDP-mannose 4,6-dehydratase [Ignavibacteria bacterium]|nr:GDP-mannose 4,6-dehydratase [Ignavibacteria bacterium]
MTKNGRVLVTGGAGFIGSHLVDQLLTAGYEVGVVDNLSTGNRANLNPAGSFHHCDITDRPALERVLREHRPEIVFHHAAQMNVRKSVSDPSYDASVNILGFLQLMECCVTAGVRKVLFASTGGAVYGEQQTFPADENHRTFPLSPYGVAKLAAEKYLYYYHKVHGLNSVVLRYANVYGPRQNAEGEAGVVAVFGNRMLQSQQPVINGDGGQTRDFVYVDDVVRANMAALRTEGFHTYNVGTGIETTIVSVYEAVSREVGWQGTPGKGPEQKGEQRRSVLDCEKIGRELGWSPTVSFQEGIRATVRSFREELNH